MRLPYVRFTPRRTTLLALGVTTMSAGWQAAPPPGPAQATPPGTMTLLGTLSEWKYPGSNMLGGATMSDGGNPLVVDVKCRAILTTPDPIEKVIEFYSEKVEPPPASGGPNARAEVKEADAKAVSIQDDSK